MSDSLEVRDTIQTSPLTAEKLLLAAKIKSFLDAGAEISMGEGDKLYPNQLTAIDKLYRFLLSPEGDDIGYIVQPTGSGKTLIMALIVKLFDVDTLMLVPRVNLLEYTKNELIALGIKAEDIGIVGGGLNEIGRKITLSTYQSHLSRKNEPTYSEHNKSKKFIVCDEAHTALGEQTRAAISHVLADDNEDEETDDIIDADELRDQEAGLKDVTQHYLGQAVILGFTATPQLAGKSVGAYFKNEIARDGIINLMKAEVLAKLRVAQLSGDIIKGVEMEGERMTHDQQEKILSRNDAYKRLLDKYEQVFQQMLEDDQLPRAVARCTNIKEAGKFVELLIKRGFRARLCTSRDEDAKTPQQQRIKLAALETAMLKGQLDVIVTVDKLAMGWNFPLANIAIDATASASPAKIIQFVGRILRRAKNKTYATLICMSWLVQVATKNKPDNVVAEGSVQNTPAADDPDDDTGTTEGSVRKKRYDFFRALLDSGEDIDEVLSILKDESGMDVSCNRDEIQDTGEQDLQYFTSVDNVRHDLNGYASGTNTTVSELVTSRSYRDVYIVCANGERVSWNRYAIRAATALKLTSVAEALVKLKMTIGLEAKKVHLPMDATYFACSDCIRADLQNYADAVGLANISKLSINPRYNAEEVPCRNGDQVKWQTYMRKAMTALGCESAAPALMKLKELVGLKVIQHLPMDAVYFRCSTCVRTDLQTYADQVRVSIVDLTKSMQGLSNAIVCSNGEPVTFQTYVRRATKGLGENSQTAALEELKKLIGLETKAYIEMDKIYFSCPDCIKNDLENYAAAAGVTVLRLTTTDRFMITEAVCSSGESVKFDTYLYRAKRVLEAASASAALVELKNICSQNDKFDQKYFAQKDRVARDLEAYAAVAEISPTRLSTSSHLNSIKAVCANGELVRWHQYLSHASTALNVATRREALDILRGLSKEV